MPNTRRLPSELTIYTVSELRPQWLAWLAAPHTADNDTCHVEASAVAEVDAAGLQLLLALFNSLAQERRTLQLTNASASLVAACHAVGASVLLGSDNTTGVPA